jgi:hypothetical protein
MRQGRVREVIEATEASIARALGFIGTDNAPAEELVALDRLRAARAAGPVRDVILALAEVGRLQRCPAGFWREVRRAAHLAGIPLPGAESAEPHATTDRGLDRE